LIHLLRQRHHRFWTEAGSPKASPWGYVQNPFNARRFILSQADRDLDDTLLCRFCSVYRAFNVVFTSLVVLAPVVSLAVVWTLARK
jgi:hypothetical protein